MNETLTLDMVCNVTQGSKYWRFEGDVLDEDYPRDISVGFENIPDDVDAAFAIPAPAYNKKEKAYFFKGVYTKSKQTGYYYHWILDFFFFFVPW